MYITKEKFEEICKKYPTLLVLDGDAVDALNFVQDLLEAEADALKVQEPTAVNSIKRLDAAAYEVFNVQSDIENEEFLEQEEELESDEPRVVRTMEDLKEFLEEQDWSVNSYETDVEIGQYSPAGEDFWFSVIHDGDVDKAIEEIKEYARDFDIDEHVQACMGMRGAPGVEELVDDAKAIQGMLNKLADAVDTLEVAEEQPALDDVIKDCAEQADKSRDTGKDVIKQER